MASTVQAAPADASPANGVEAPRRSALLVILKEQEEAEKEIERGLRRQRTARRLLLALTNPRTVHKPAERVYRPDPAFHFTAEEIEAARQAQLAKT